MSERDPHLCPVCGCARSEVKAVTFSDTVHIKCPNCGDHLLAGSAEAVAWRLADQKKSGLAYAVRKVPAGEYIHSQLITDMTKHARLPDAQERIDNLVIYLAKEGAPGALLRLTADWMKASIGAATRFEAQWVIQECRRLGLMDWDSISTDRTDDLWEATGAVLTMAGWNHYQELMRKGAGSRHAFMAMKFGDVELEWLFTEHLQRAVEQTNFKLRTTRDEQAAGSIDNRMRVEIRTSRFVVCDLTHSNRGAYWEAGFAEGLGRPVIYICRRDQMESQNKDERPHFDIRQQLIIPWDAANPGPAMEELKATIRATLPAEARMQDA